MLHKLFDINAQYTYNIFERLSNNPSNILNKMMIFMDIKEFYLEASVTEDRKVKKNENYVKLDYQQKTAISSIGIPIKWGMVQRFADRLKKAGAADQVTVYDRVPGARSINGLRVTTRVYYAGPDGKAIKVD